MKKIKNKLLSEKIIYILCIFLIIYIIVKLLLIKFIEPFALKYINNDDIILKDYENFPVGNNKVYEDITILLNENPNLNTEKKVIVYVLNTDTGFGSQLTIFSQHLQFLKEYNSNIICIPHFSINSKNFKYHNNKYNNSFFIYFKKKNDVINLNEYKIFFINSKLIKNYPFLTGEIPPINNEPAKTFIRTFIDNYYLIKNNSIIEDFNKIKLMNKPIIGIHIRSIFQKKIHQNEYLEISIKDRLYKIKEDLNKINNYCIFIATDVNSYIEMSKDIFGDIYYFDNITRINVEEDIISSINNKDIDNKLGFDILNECLALSMCDKIYVSNSNIPFIITLINPEIKMELY
jgi:hypothetical protein